MHKNILGGGSTYKSVKSGFTIIEVVLVLAIGSLIFLMVFVALPSLQRSQRNAQRKDDMSRVLTAIEEYRTNNSGNTPFYRRGQADLNFLKRYVDPEVEYVNVNPFKNVKACGDKFRDPDGTCYQFVSRGIMTEDGNFMGNEHRRTEFDHVIYVYIRAKCGDDENTYKLAEGIRDYAIFYIMEGNSVHCIDNN